MFLMLAHQSSQASLVSPTIVQLIFILSSGRLEKLMIICSCNVVTDREVRRAALEGASTLRELARSCRAGTACGGCRPALKALLEESRRDAAVASPLPRSTSELELAAS